MIGLRALALFSAAFAVVHARPGPELFDDASLSLTDSLQSEATNQAATICVFLNAECTIPAPISKQCLDTTFDKCTVIESPLGKIYGRFTYRNNIVYVERHQNADCTQPDPNVKPVSGAPGSCLGPVGSFQTINGYVRVTLK